MAPKDRNDTEGPSRRPRSTSLQRGGDPFESWGGPYWPFGSLAERLFGRGLSDPRDPRGWQPQIETFQRGDQYVIRVDLPGMNRDDVTVEVGDDQVIIQGERRDEREEQGQGFYRSERSYGRFYRTVQLPEGSLADSAEASFRNGVLEITITAPPREVTRGRRIEIAEASESGDKRQIRERRQTPENEREATPEQGTPVDRPVE
jgi:HSP20 family protein